MGQFEETEEGVRPSETSLCGQHDNQTKAQSPWLTAGSRHRAGINTRMETLPSFRTASWSQMDSGKSSSSVSKKKVARSDDNSSDSENSLKSQASSGSSCVSDQSKRSIDRNIDFKMNPWLTAGSRHRAGINTRMETLRSHRTASRSQLRSGRSSSSDLKRKLTTSEYFPSDDKISRRVSRKRRKRESSDYSTTFKKNQEKEWLMRWILQHTEQQHNPESQVLTIPMVCTGLVSRSSSHPKSRRVSRKTRKTKLYKKCASFKKRNSL